MRGADAALRATAFDAAYWRARYAKNDGACEWYVTLGRDNDAGAAAASSSSARGAEAQLAQARPARRAGPALRGCGS